MVATVPFMDPLPGALRGSPLLRSLLSTQPRNAANANQPHPGFQTLAQSRILEELAQRHGGAPRRSQPHHETASALAGTQDENGPGAPLTPAPRLLAAHEARAIWMSDPRSAPGPQQIMRR